MVLIFLLNGLKPIPIEYDHVLVSICSFQCKNIYIILCSLSNMRKGIKPISIEYDHVLLSTNPFQYRNISVIFIRYLICTDEKTND